MHQNQLDIIFIIEKLKGNVDNEIERTDRSIGNRIFTRKLQLIQLKNKRNGFAKLLRLYIETMK